jgi:hypothetical protein
MDITEKLEKGYIQSRVIIEVVGKPKEHVEKTLKDLIEQIKKRENIELLKQEVSEAKEVNDENNPDLWATFSEIEMLTKDIKVLVNFCFDFMPSSVEIIEPKELKLKDNDISNVLNDLQGRLHQVDLVAKRLNNENQFLKNNMHALIKNFVSILLINRSLSSEQLSKVVGMEKQELENFLEIMIKENRLNKEDGKYTVVKNGKREKQD